MQALFLTKTTSNDMYVVGIGNSVRLTRAVKRIYKDWVPQLEMYQKFGVHSWMVEGALGGRLKPGIAKKPEPHMLNFEDVPGESVPDLDDQASGDDMILDFDGNQIPYSLMHPSSLGIEGTSVPEQCQPTSGTVEVQVAESPPRCTEDRDGGDEPASKRARISRLSVNQVEVHHVDDTCMIPDGIDMLDIDGILEHDSRHEFDTHEDADHDFIARAHSMEGLDDSMFWFPFSDVEPELPDEVLRTIDDLADSVEIRRLINMGVLHPLGSSATNILVAPWEFSEKKWKHGEPHWLRRSRFVAREYNFLDARVDVYDPASTSICNRLLPALIMSELCGDTAIMGAFDISDAYLQVDQPTPKKICIIDRPDANYIIHRCLPGQRDGARRWCDHFSSFVQTDLGREICAEVPSLFKLPDDKGVLFAHVDDVLFAIDEQYLNSVANPILEARFRISVQTASRSGGSFEFLKRVHEFEPNYVTGNQPWQQTYQTIFTNLYPGEREPSKIE